MQVTRDQPHELLCMTLPALELGGTTSPNLLPFYLLRLKSSVHSCVTSLRFRSRSGSNRWGTWLFRSRSRFGRCTCGRDHRTVGNERTVVQVYESRSVDGEVGHIRAADDVVTSLAVWGVVKLSAHIDHGSRNMRVYRYFDFQDGLYCVH